MVTVTFIITQLKELDRPDTYMADMEACAIHKTDTHWTFDKKSECYLALIAKYRTAALVRVQAIQSPQSSGEVKKSTMSLRSKPCGGCGRKKK